MQHLLRHYEILSDKSSSWISAEPSSARPAACYRPYTLHTFTLKTDKSITFVSDVQMHATHVLIIKSAYLWLEDVYLILILSIENRNNRNRTCTRPWGRRARPQSARKTGRGDPANDPDVRGPSPASNKIMLLFHVSQYSQCQMGLTAIDAKEFKEMQGSAVGYVMK